MKKHLTILLLFSLVLSMLWMFSSRNRNRKYPTEGVWYCKEHQIQISYEPPEYECYVTVDGEQVKCEGARKKGKSKLILRCAETDSPHFDYKEKVFVGDMVSSNDEKFILRGDDGTRYVFVRRE